MDIMHKLFNVNTQIVDEAKYLRQAANNRRIVKANLGTCHVLSRAQKEECIAFWKPIHKHFTTDFHDWYTKCTGIFDVRYVPDDLWFSRIDAFYNDRKAARYLDNKCLYDRLFRDVRMPEVLGKRMNGFWFDEKNKQTGLETLIKGIPASDPIFVKIATNSFGGGGVHYLKEDKSQFIQYIASSTCEDIVIQKELTQHAWLSRLNPSSVNTIRVLSFLRQNGVQVLSTILRMGLDGSKVDNSCSGGITCGVTKDGVLKSRAFSQIGELFEKEHPTSKTLFESVTIPGYDKILSATKQLHIQIPFFRLVSWDWAVDDTGEPVLIEANLCNGELDFHQLNNGPVFDNDTNSVLMEVFSRGHQQ